MDRARLQRRQVNRDGEYGRADLDTASLAPVPGRVSAPRDAMAAPTGAVAGKACLLAHGAVARVGGWLPELAAALSRGDYLEAGRLGFEIRSALRRALLGLENVDAA